MILFLTFIYFTTNTVNFLRYPELKGLLALGAQPKPMRKLGTRHFRTHKETEVLFFFAVL